MSEAVIEIMAVVGDLVGDVCHLRLQRSAGEGLRRTLTECLGARNPVVLAQPLQDLVREVQPGKLGYTASINSTTRKLWTLCSKPPSPSISSFKLFSPAMTERGVAEIVS